MKFLRDRKTIIKKAALRLYLPTGSEITLTNNINRLLGQYQMNIMRFKKNLQPNFTNYENNLMIKIQIKLKKFEDYEILVGDLHKKFILDNLSIIFKLKFPNILKVKESNRKKYKFPTFIIYNFYKIWKLQNFNKNNLIFFHTLRSYRDLFNN